MRSGLRRSLEDAGCGRRVPGWVDRPASVRVGYRALVICEQSASRENGESCELAAKCPSSETFLREILQVREAAKCLRECSSAIDNPASLQSARAVSCCELLALGSQSFGAETSDTNRTVDSGCEAKKIPTCFTFEA
jgi:hypothetical protein